MKKIFLLISLSFLVSCGSQTPQSVVPQQETIQEASQEIASAATGSDIIPIEVIQEDISSVVDSSQENTPPIVTGDPRDISTTVEIPNN